jgi:hypothetical protein
MLLTLPLADITYKKTSAPHNIVRMFRDQGYTQKQAYAKADELLHERYETWFSILAEIPIYDEQTEIEVRKYVNACEKIVLANLHWRYDSCFPCKSQFTEDIVSESDRRGPSFLPLKKLLQGHGVPDIRLG